MILEDARKLTDLFTSKASELTSQLAYAGIAVIWVFRLGEHSTSLPPALLWPLALFVLSLFFHYLHYVVAGFLWDRFTTLQEQKYGSDKDTKIEDSPTWINAPHAVCYVIKIVALFFGYGLLLWEIASKLV